MSDSTTVAVVNQDDDAVAAAIEDIRNGKALAYNSIQGTDMATRLRILEAVTESEPISDNLNRTFSFKDIIIQKVALADQQTGVISDQPRIIFLTDEGLALHAISQGLLRSVNNLIGIAGEPSTWPADNLPKGYFVKVGPAGRQYFTMKFGDAAKGKK